MRRDLRIGCGAGFAGDRIDAAAILAERVDLDYLVLEVLGERTVALAQLRKLENPRLGYDALLVRRMEALLPVLARKRTRLVSNMGAANPVAAAEAIVDTARRLGLILKVAAVLGDDVLARLDRSAPTLETDKRLGDLGEIVSANAYLGAEALLPALASDAQVIVAGRVADPSLFVAPMMAAFGWRPDDWLRLGRGTAAGHLLECAGQLTGGYFAEPGRKDVPDMANLGFPYAVVDGDGGAEFATPPGTGGRISVMTAKEQMYYEVTDPAAYLTPDVTADFSAVPIREAAPGRVAVAGATGRARPATLKVTVGYRHGFIGEGDISYAGPGAAARGRLAQEIVKQRLAGVVDELRVELIGVDAAHRRFYGNLPEPYEVRLRAAGRAGAREAAARVGEEVEALYTNGPAAGGGVRQSTRAVVGVVSALIPRASVACKTLYFSS
ncbi:MAG: acyclic terpene utilization AtuA family protein [Rhodospirillales bacterium]